MAQSKDPVLKHMREATVSKHVYDDFPAFVALLASLDYWSKRDSSHALGHAFVQTFFNRENFHLSYEKLGEICHYSEKAMRIQCRKFTERFSDDYRHFLRLPFPLLVSHYVFCTFDPFINDVIESYRLFSFRELPDLISERCADPKERNLCLNLHDYFLRLGMRQAI